MSSASASASSSSTKLEGESGTAATSLQALSQLPPLQLAIRGKLGVQLRTGPFSNFQRGTSTVDTQVQARDLLITDAGCGSDGSVQYTPDGKHVLSVHAQGLNIFAVEAQGNYLPPPPSTTTTTTTATASTTTSSSSSSSSSSNPSSPTYTSPASLSSSRVSLVTTLAGGRMEHFYISPLGTYVVTWQRKTNNTQSTPNFCVWRLSTGQCVLAYHLNEYDPHSAHKPLAWTDDEELLAYLPPSREHIVLLSGQNPQADVILSTVTLNNIALFAWAPVIKPYTLAVCTMGKGTDPWRVNILQYPKLTDKDIVTSKSFFKCEEVSLKFSPTGQAVLIETRTSTDTTGKSYYGESNLHLLHIDGSFSGTVPFGGNAGPIQDVSWSPMGKEFIVIQGFQPAKATLFLAANCTPIREYGAASRNTVRWSPHGRFVMIGGFGNLAGEMDFWDNFKFKKMGECIDRDGAKSYDWTPDGRYFITASLRPWRRVDNGYKIFTYYGELVYHEKYDELYQVVVRPPPHKDTYPNRPQSPRLKDLKKQQAAGTTNNGAAGASTTGGVVSGAGATVKTGAYIPPHLRAKGVTSTIGIVGAAKKENDSGPRKLTQQDQKKITQANAPTAAAAAASTSSNKPVVPGASADDDEEEGGELSANQLKRRKKKEAAARREAEEKAAAEAAAALAAQKAAAAKDAAEKEKEEMLKDPALIAKRIKNIQRKLRDIQSIKDRMDKGEKIDHDQQVKMDKETELNEEMKMLAALQLDASSQ